MIPVLVFLLFYGWGSDSQINQPTNQSTINQEAIVNRHNHYRSELGISPLEFSQECADYAQKWADYLAKSKNCNMVHSNTNKYGENIYWSSYESTEEEVVDDWAEEMVYFNKTTKKFNTKCGHYSQMIWGKTQFVGTGMAKCKNGSQIWVCTYYPAGNFIGEKVY